MTRPNPDPSFDPDQIENQDPLGEQEFDTQGFSDAPDGGPDRGNDDLADPAINKRPGRGGQTIAGVPPERQHELNSSDLGRPDSSRVVIRERGGKSKGDPAVGGTRPD
jgi:hypothetical protein